MTTKHPYPKDASGTVFDPVLHNLLEETAQPQLSQKGNFCKCRPSNPNSEELIARFHAGLSEVKTDTDILDELLAGGDEDADLDAPLEESVTTPAGDEIATDEGIDDLVVEDAQTPDDSDNIMAEAEPTATPDNAKALRDEYKGNIDIEMIRQTCRASRKSLNPTADRPNFSNGGTKKNGWQGNGYNLRNIILKGEDLRAAIFNNCDLRGANFTDCNLEGAMFVGANLEGAVFTGAQLRFGVFPRDFEKAAKTDGQHQLKHIYRG